MTPDLRTAPTAFDPFAGGALVSSGPTTEAQREILAACRLGEDAGLCYNEAIHLAFDGPLDADLLERGLRELYRRHDALRSTFSRDNDAFFVWDVDLAVARAAVEPEGAAEALDARLRAATAEPFDVDRGPLFRATLLRSGPERWDLVLAAHHLVCDGWSFGVLVRELAEAYRAGRSGASMVGGPAPTFGDYAAAEGASASAPDEIAFWRRLFEGPVPVLELPTPNARPSPLRFAAGRVDAPLDPATVAALRACAGGAGASLFALLLGGFYAFLHRLTGQTHLVLAVPSAGQAVAGQPGLVGHCVNVLPLPVAMDGAETFPALVRRVAGRLHDAFDHPRFTLGRLLRTVNVPRDPARRPAASVMFNLDRAFDRETEGFAGLGVRIRSVPRVAEYFELFVNLVEGADGIVVECQYNASLFDAVTVEAWIASYVTLLRDAAGAGNRRVEDLEWVPAAAREALSGPWQGETAALSAATVPDLIRATCARRPDGIALRGPSGAVTYAALGERVDAVAAALRARGIGAGHLVGVSLARGPDLPVALLGIMAVGAAYLPLDLAHPPARLRLVLDDARPTVVLHDLGTESAVERLRGEGASWIAVPFSRVASGPGDVRLAQGPAAPAADHRPGAGDCAYVMYTSGSTGTPKGVRVPQRAIVNLLEALARRLGVDAGDAVPSVTTPTFDISLLELLLPLAVGGTTVFLEDPTLADVAALERDLDRQGVTVMQATPSAWGMLVEGGWRGRPGLRVLAGGEALPARLAASLLERADEVWNMYGPTETTVWSACHRVTRGEDPVPIGRPIANTVVHVVDGRGRPVPPGVPGEIVIGGAGVAEGYHARPEETDERFVAVGPWEAGRSYRTGDVGHWSPSGHLYFGGRKDDQVKLRGHRVELADVEAALASHPGVSAAGAALRSDAQGDPRLIGFVQVAPGADPDEAALRAHMRGLIPEYMVPQRFVRVDRIPRSPAGKIDRRGLPSGLPTEDRAQTPAAPPTEEVLAVAEVWSAVLGVPVGVPEQDFFELGGHSILAMRAVARVNVRLGVELTLRDLFEASRLGAFSERVAAARAQGGTWEEFVV